MKAGLRNRSAADPAHYPIDTDPALLHPAPHMSTIKISAKQLTRAATIQAKIEQLEKQAAELKEELAAVLSGGSASSAKKAAPAKAGKMKKAPAKKKGKRTISAETRARMAASAKRRYAKLKKTPAQKAAPAKAAKVKKAPARKAAPAKKGKRTMSPEGRARIVAAAKLRWAKHRAAKK